MNFLYQIRLKRKVLESSLRIKQENIAIRKAFSADAGTPFFAPWIKAFQKPLYIAIFSLFCFVFVKILITSKSSVKIQEKEPVIAAKFTPVITSTKPEKKISKPVIEKMPIIPVEKKESEINIFDTRQEYVLLVSKKNRNLLLLKNHEKTVELVKKFAASVGKATGDKQFEGDMKTPEGIYKIIKIKQKKELPKIFGPMAFVLNYPNNLDKKSGKTGSNIWIHGTGMGMNKITPDTKGCVEISDKDIIMLSKYIGLETEIIIFSEDYNILQDFEDKYMSKAKIKKILVDDAKI